MKLKEYLYCLVADQPVAIEDAEEDECFYDPYEDWYGCVKFYVKGFQKVKDKLGFKGMVK